MIEKELRDLISGLCRQVMLIGAEDAACGSPSNVKFMRDAFEYLERYNGITPEYADTIAEQVEILEQWKRDAIVVLGGWEKVAKMVERKPGDWGKSKSVAVADEIERLRKRG